MAAQPDRLSRLPWRKSSASGNQPDCVEVAPCDGMIMVRDSYHPRGPFLGLPPGAWTNLIDGLREE
ncbi:uncharacterized protein DUF397 [Actinocorallia herbida]|uniref:Uncharacterized protein DUF397 n=1 Tax=Actinocorallia herbida TaxID=58109 RepID=A0A3N1DC08_9ACTN|nr:DUF397 domain-containing protein [Actinocorallia herbida]ROO91006.1 uncharacterized protein DUF397 [Actinocorallia herbida]